MARLLLVSCLFLVSFASADAGPAWIGVLTEDAADGGVLVVAVHPGGPADVAGIVAGDVLVEAEGAPLVRAGDLSRTLGGRAAGERLAVAVTRGDRRLHRELDLGERVRTIDIRAPAELWPAPLGIDIADVTPDLRRYLGAPEDAGVLVTRVREGRAAARAGVRVGDILLRIGEEPVVDSLHGARLLRAAEGAEVRAAVVRPHGKGVFTVALPPARLPHVAGDRRALLEEELARLTDEAKELDRRIRALRAVLRESR